MRPIREHVLIAQGVITHLQADIANFQNQRQYTLRILEVLYPQETHFDITDSDHMIAYSQHCARIRYLKARIAFAEERIERWTEEKTELRALISTITV